MNKKSRYGAFIIPHSDKSQSQNHGKEQIFIDDAIEGLFSQTDDDWCVIVVVNAFPGKKTTEYLNALKEKHYPKIDVVFLEHDVGPGVCRNLGVLRALESGSSAILFNDSDDVSHPKRLETTKRMFLANPQIGLIYSSFEVIDENNRLVPIEKISSPILEILESHGQNPPEGDGVWIKMGTETGYANLTSSTSVRIRFAYQCPFPNENASEDFHAWMRMSSCGAHFKYTELIPSKYRIPSYVKHQSSRNNLGLSKFNQTKARVDADGFSKAAEIAVTRNTLKPEEVPMLKSKFYRRLAKTMKRENEEELVKDLLKLSEQQENEGLIYHNKQRL